MSRLEISETSLGLLEFISRWFLFVKHDFHVQAVLTLNRNLYKNGCIPFARCVPKPSPLSHIDPTYRRRGQPKTASRYTWLNCSRNQLQIVNWRLWLHSNPTENEKDGMHLLIASNGPLKRVCWLSLRPDEDARLPQKKSINDKLTAALQSIWFMVNSLEGESMILSLAVQHE